MTSLSSSPQPPPPQGPDAHIPKHFQELQAFLSKTISDVGRCVVKSNDADLEEMHSGNFYLHLFLYNYFKKKSIEQKKVDALAITETTAMILMHKILLPNLQGGANSKKFLTLDAVTAKKTEYYPLMPQRTLRELLGGQKVVLEAFAEVVEVCNHLDYLQGHKKAGFGVVNLLHFVAVALTLLPTEGVPQLLSLILDDSDVPMAIRYKITYLWSLVDTVNVKVLEGVCERLLSQATGGYSYIDVTALPPMSMNGPSQSFPPTVSASAPSHTHASASEGQLVREALQKRESDKEDEAEAAPKPSQTSQAPRVTGPRVVYHAVEEEVGSGEEAPRHTEGTCPDGGSDNDANFWAQLAS